MIDDTQNSDIIMRNDETSLSTPSRTRPEPSNQDGVMGFPY